MMANIWIELQEARKILALLKKHGTHKVEEASSGMMCITDKNGDIIYESKSYDSERCLLYAVDCHKNGYTPNAIALQDFDPMD
jgi:hypothetical protein